jgi:hypothetical protein
MHARYLWLVLAACGGGGSSGDKPDAPDGVIDAADIDAPDNMITCAYTEAADATNTNAAGAEPTSLTFGTQKTSICGKINNGHFNASTGAVDVDAFKITVTAQTGALVHLTGQAGGLQIVALQVATGTGQLLALGTYEGDHATTSVRLPAGETTLAVVAVNAADIGAPIDYAITIVEDKPMQRCPKSTAAPYNEVNDGAQNDGNDIYRFSQTADPQTSFTAQADAPEPSGVTANASMSYLLHGSSANVNPNDDYQDRDTFAFTTGATTTQLSVRLNWTATTVDFDFKVYPMMSLVSIGAGLKTSNTEDEFHTFAVKPNTQYWLWVGAFDGATALPATYDATLCAEAFAIP